MNNSFLIGDIINYQIASTLEYLDSDDTRENFVSHFLLSPCVHFPPSKPQEMGEYISKWVTYRRTSCEPIFSKDGIHIDRITFEINVACTSYIDSISAATLVRERFDGARQLANGEDDHATLFMKNVRLVNAEESYDFDMYVQSMEFVCECHTIAGKSHLQQLIDAEEAATTKTEE